MRRVNADTDVLICGAGPTGLVLALRLARAGVRLRIIDAAAEPGTTSRALVVHARTLEFYRQTGLADDLLADSLRFEAANLWVRGAHAARVPFGAMGKGLSRYPYAVVYPQDRHERLLIEHLQRSGVEVERAVSLVGFEQTDDHVEARLRRAGGEALSCTAAYLAGCDGAHSAVREGLDTGFPGGTYSRMFYVADVDATGPVMNDELHVALDRSDFLGIFPLRGGRTGRLIGTIHAAHDDEPLTWDDVAPTAIERLGIDIERVNWFSTYRVHHRVARHFHQGRVFLLGDAAHIHSPVGGQGMNTGIGDAVNLAWKLADVVQGRTGPTLLDSYEPERIAFAQRLVRTTDRAFVIASSPGRLARFVRVRIVPWVLPLLFRLRIVRRLMYRVVSQISISYRASPISAGTRGAVRGGDRLPWVDLDGPDNHADLDGVQWRVHVYGRAGSTLAQACSTLRLPLAVHAWTPAMNRAGLRRDAIYLVRPDGYIGLVDAGPGPERLERYMRSLGWNNGR